VAGVDELKASPTDTGKVQEGVEEKQAVDISIKRKGMSRTSTNTKMLDTTAIT
jgi:hypothetical protein